MKANSRFWSVVLIALACFVSGYMGFLFLLPNKTSAIPGLLICLLLIVAGVVILLAALVYTATKFIVERLRCKRASTASDSVEPRISGPTPGQ
jgi:hypothetical protein